MFKHSEISHAGATSMMDSEATNFAASQYGGTYSKPTLNDKLFDIMGEMNNAVPLILHPFQPKGKMLCCTGHLN